MQAQWGKMGMQALCWVSGGRRECRLCVGSVGVEGNAGSVLGQ